MSFLERLEKIRVVKESSYRTDPGSGYQDLYVSNLTFTPGIEPIERPDYRDNLTMQSPAAGKHSAVISFRTDAIGTTDGTAPDWTILLQGCGFDAGTLTANNGIVFDLLDRSLSSITIHYWEEDEATAANSIQHVLLGCRGTCEANFAAGQLKSFTWTFEAIWDVETAGTNDFYVGAQTPTAGPPTQSFDSQLPVTMLTAAAANPAIIIGGGGWYLNNLIVPSFTFTLNNQISRSEDLNSVSGFKRINITGRNAQLTMSPELETMSASGTSGIDFVKLLKQKTKFGIATRGSRTAGEQVVIGFPQATLREHGREYREGIVATPWTMDLTDLAAVTGVTASNSGMTTSTIYLASGAITNNGNYVGAKFKVTAAGTAYYSIIVNSTAADDSIVVDPVLGAAPATSGGDTYQVDGKEAVILIA